MKNFKILIFFTIFFLYQFTAKSDGLFDMNALMDQMNKGLSEAQQNDNQGNFNADGTINFENAFENATNAEPVRSEYSMKSVGAPAYCPHWNSALITERMDAQERYPTEQFWAQECHKFYPDVDPPKVDIESLCSIMPQECEPAKQWLKYDELRREALLDYSKSIVKIAEAIGLKENAAGLQATLEYFDGERIAGSREYNDKFGVAWTETVVLIDEINKRIESGYIPSASEVALLEEAVKLKNQAALKWIQQSKELAKLQNMNSGSLLVALGNLNVMTGDKMNGELPVKSAQLEIKLKEYQDTVSKNSGTSLNLEDVNLEKEMQDIEF